MQRSPNAQSPNASDGLNEEDLMGLGTTLLRHPSMKKSPSLLKKKSSQRIKFTAESAEHEMFMR